MAVIGNSLDKDKKLQEGNEATLLKSKVFKVNYKTLCVLSH